MRALVIGPDEAAKLKALREKAEAEPFTMDNLLFLTIFLYLCRYERKHTK
jgi:hypothetical protein